MYNSLNIIEVLSGTNNSTHPIFVENAQLLDGKNKKKAIHAFKHFMIAIEKQKKEINLDNIVASKGNVAVLKEYDYIKDAIKILEDAKVTNVNSVKDVLKCLENNKALYIEAYDKNVRLVKYEYEAAVMSIIDALTYLLAGGISLEINSRGLNVKGLDITTKPMILELVDKMASLMTKKEHPKYLDAMIKSSLSPKELPPVKKEEEVVSEAVASAATTTAAIRLAENLTAMLVNVIKGGVSVLGSAYMSISLFIKTLFGIVPLIRACIYHYYNRKVNKVLKLEDSVEFLKRNIDKLKRNDEMDPEKKAKIIAKQEAVVEMWTKKAAKIRAQFSDTGIDTSNQLKSSDIEIREKIQKPSDDEFNLEL